MPRSNTEESLTILVLIILDKLSLIRCGGKPRRPSLPPSSSMISLGEYLLSALSILVRPPSVVSPLILALTT